MFITNLEIEHFRGIQKGNIVFPLDSRVICMIGAGDSTKSTILKAIEWVFWPSWNLICQRRNKKHLKRRPENDPNAGNTYAG